MEHTIKLNDKHLQIISAALCEMPFRVAAPVVDAINRQIQQGHRSSTPLDENGIEINA
jgi:bifunctional pyridoxal-dependent enzyme with beta-cystathionase and maltose regulon repressor activities